MASVCRNLLSSKNLDQHAISLTLALEIYSHRMTSAFPYSLPTRSSWGIRKEPYHMSCPCSFPKFTAFQYMAAFSRFVYLLKLPDNSLVLQNSHIRH
jgi:hypothetical protein